VLFSLHSTPIVQELRLVYNTLKPLGGIIVVLFCYLFFVSWIATLLFASPVPETQGRVYFGSLLDTAWSLWIGLTTANYPDLMMPAYNASRVSCFMFIGFISLGTFFLLPVVTAVVFNAYNGQVERLASERKEFQDGKLRLAFALLDLPERRGQLSRARIREVFTELNRYRTTLSGHGRSKIGKNKARLLFAALDVNRTGTVDVQEFLGLCDLLNVRFQRIHEMSALGLKYPHIFVESAFAKWCVATVRNPWFDRLIDALLLLNSVLLFVEERNTLIGHKIDGGYAYIHDPHDGLEGVEVAWEGALDVLFALLFCVEMGVKILGLGWYEYKAHLRHRFDGFVTIVGVLNLLLTAFGGEAIQQSNLTRWMVALRLGRLCRLIGAIPQVALVVSTFIRMVPAASKLLRVLFVAMFSFSVLGGQLFGGLINYGPQYQALNTTVVATDYWANNFNDVMSGMVVCFELLVVNNWFVIVDGFSAVAPMPIVRLFAIAVYIVGVLVSLNIAIAFALNAFEAAAAAKELAKAGEGAGGDEEEPHDEDLDGAGSDGDEDDDESRPMPGLDESSTGIRAGYTDSISLSLDTFQTIIPAHLQQSAVRGPLQQMREKAPSNAATQSAAKRVSAAKRPSAAPTIPAAHRDSHVPAPAAGKSAAPAGDVGEAEAGGAESSAEPEVPPGDAAAGGDDEAGQNGDADATTKAV
jgi:two pore calcium channel protein